MVDLKKLKILTENLTILYVEDSGALLKRMGMFLNNIFKEVYQAANGEEGMKQYQLHKPDIVITDLNMPVMDGHTMIMKLKKIDPKVNIIIMSAYSDTDNLLKSMHLGVADFVPKPVDSKLLQGVLYKVARDIIKNSSSFAPQEATIHKEDISIVDELIMKRLEVIHKSHLLVELVNHYKGVPIVDKGKITTVENKNITIKVPFFQGLAIKFEGSTIIQSELLDSDIQADLKKVGYNEALVLENLRYINQSFKRRKQLTIEPDDNLKVILTDKNAEFELEVAFISIDLIIVKCREKRYHFKESEEVKLEIAIKTFSQPHTIKEELLHIKGEIFSIDNDEITILFQIQDRPKELLNEYILKRRVDLITEFKQLKKV